ncbi:MAG: biotin/lipoate A/B protein ligase family protein [Candidatus Odinarchaeota archaeon]
MSSNWKYLELSYKNTNANIALEEALIRARHKVSGSNIFRLWFNPPAVIIGRNQDLQVEADVNFCQKSGIDIARRASGGGTVFIDRGTLLVTFLVELSLVKNLETSRYSYFQDTISKALDKFGIPSKIGERGAIITPEGKISGTAQHQLGNYLLHHSTLLVSSDLFLLERSLQGREPPPDFRKVKSHRMPVTTVEKILGRSLEMQEMINVLLESVEGIFEIQLIKGDITPLEQRFAKHLFENKYTKVRWLTEGKY